MKKAIPFLFLLSLIFIAASCAPAGSAVIAATPHPPTIDEIDGLWESEYGFFFHFDQEAGTFSGSNEEEAALAQLGILGTFSLEDGILSMVENDDSDSCPGVEGRFETLLTYDDRLRLSIIEDPCLYRVEGLFQGGQGGNRLLEFKRMKD